MDDANRRQLFCVVPAFRAAATIADVVAQALRYAHSVVVVDDGCPQRTGAVARAAFADADNVFVLERQRNGGVGAAMKTGIKFCLERGADVIVKLDADGQIDPTFIPVIADVLTVDTTLVCVKGNRFFDSTVMLRMPKRRLFGNAVLSVMTKFASGHWNIVDPTNGYLAFNARLLAALPWRAFADSYFFEISVLCELGLRRLPLLELEMPTIYNGAPSSLSIPAILWEFPPRLLRLTYAVAPAVFCLRRESRVALPCVRSALTARRRLMGRVSVDRELDHARLALDRHGHARGPAVPDGFPTHSQRANG